MNDWYNKATEVMERELAVSNFYSVMHEVYLDRCLTGTGCMFSEMNLNKQLILGTSPRALMPLQNRSPETWTRWCAGSG